MNDLATIFDQQFWLDMLVIVPFTIAVFALIRFTK